jgi:acyl-[acyl-carrier-protein] desaturase
MLAPMTSPKTDAELLAALEQVAEENYDRHVGAAQDWESHDFVPWAEGRNFAFLGGEDWAAEQSGLTDVDRIAATVGVLIADNLPAYHRDLAFSLRKKGVWWKWIGRWTAEENRHAIVLRDFLMTTRSVDPVELERVRIDYMTQGYSAPSLHVVDMLVKYALDETAAGLRHRKAAELATEPRLAAIFGRIAQDDELQAVFFRNLVTAALDLEPDLSMRAIADRVADFAVPVVDLPGEGSSSTLLEKAGIYTPEMQSEQVVKPLLQEWKVFERNDFGAEGNAARDEIASAVA